MYLSIYVARGAFVTSIFPRSHAYALTALHDVILMWCDSRAIKNKAARQPALKTHGEHLDRLLEGKSAARKRQ